MSKNNREIKKLVGSKVNSIKLGYGTFLTINSVGFKGENYELWIYMTDWSITKDGDEILSSDLSNKISDFDFLEVVNGELEYIEIDAVDDMEFHIVFSNSIVLEVWIDPEDGRYDSGSEMAKIYIDGEFVEKIISGKVINDVGFN